MVPQASLGYELDVLTALHPWTDLLALALAATLGFVLSGALVRLLVVWAGRTSTSVDDLFLRYERRPIRLVVTVASARAALPWLDLSPGLREALSHAHVLATILGVVWALTGALNVAEELLQTRLGSSPTAAPIRTQFHALKNILSFGIGLLGVAFALMTFSQVRQFGTSLLASAGVAGVVVGFAAQRTLQTVLAGLQLALTQPIRIGDVVVVEREWGWVDEITLTYVVVRVWDQRRLVLPVSYFLEKPFENWTRSSTDLIGSVYVYADPTVDVGAVREELRSILESTPLWDRRSSSLQVTDCAEQALTLRATMTAADSGQAWDLRCLVRERLLAFLSRDGARALARRRVQLEGLDAAGPPH